jgi:hypothetical protein
VLFVPYCDPAYTLLSCALIGLWYAALRDDRTHDAVLLGVTVAATCLITFNVLVIGLFMVAMIFVTDDESVRLRLVRACKHAAITLATAVAGFLLLWILLRHDPIATFRMAWINQHELLRQHADHRPWPQSIPFDLTDFAFGSGWIAVLLVAFLVIDRSSLRPQPRQAVSPIVLVWLAVAQLVAVAILGLLQTETARVWNFMLPLLMVGVGMELSRWPRWSRAVAYGCLLLIAAGVCQNVKLIY